jgi:hypothetical protein
MVRVCSTSGEERNAYRPLVRKPKPLERPRCRRVCVCVCVCMWRILRWVLKLYHNGVLWTGMACLGQEPAEGSCECSNRTLGSLK